MSIKRIECECEHCGVTFEIKDPLDITDLDYELCPKCKVFIKTFTKVYSNRIKTHNAQKMRLANNQYHSHTFEELVNFGVLYFNGITPKLLCDLFDLGSSEARKLGTRLKDVNCDLEEYAKARKVLQYYGYLPKES